MKTKQEEVVNKKTKYFDDRKRQERAISITCEEILDITLGMFIEEKVL